MPLASQYERALAQVGGRTWVGCTEHLGSLKQGRDCDLIADQSAFRQLNRHLHRDGSAGKEHRGRLAVKRTPNRARDTGSHRLEGDVMAEHESAVAFGDYVRVNQLFDRYKQLR